MTKFGNKQRIAFLNSIPTASIENDNDKLTQKMKFNFAYVDSSQKAGQKIEDWSEKQIEKLFNKLIDYSKESIEHWKNTLIGGSKTHAKGKVCVVYEKFPTYSCFFHPKHVPHEIFWARFRLESSVRLIGFIIPKNFNEQKHIKTGKRFDINTFYVVFLDANHKFYLLEPCP